MMLPASTASDDTLFGDALACDEVRPLAFDARALDARMMRSHAANGEALLHALAIVEDGMRPEEPETPGDGTLHRLEAKIDLLTALVAAVVPTPHDLAPRPLRWSARGARLVVDFPLDAGATGTLRVQPVDWLPSTPRPGGRRPTARSRSRRTAWRGEPVRTNNTLTVAERCWRS